MIEEKALYQNRQKKYDIKFLVLSIDSVLTVCVINPLCELLLSIFYLEDINF